MEAQNTLNVFKEEISVLEHCGKAFRRADRERLGFQMWALSGAGWAGSKGRPRDRGAFGDRRAYIWK